MSQAAKTVAAIFLILVLYPLAVSSSVADGGGADGETWLEPGETELAVEAVVTKSEEEGKQVTRLEYSAETLKNKEKLIAQRTRKLVVYYCGNFNRHIARFARDHASSFSLLAETADAFTVASSVLGLLKASDDAIVKASIAGCSDIKQGKAMQQDHLPLFILSCINNRLANGKKPKTLSVPIDAALADLAAIMECPQEMVGLAMRQLEIEYQHDGARKAVLAGEMEQAKADEFIAANPVPTRGHFRATRNEEL